MPSDLRADLARHKHAFINDHQKKLLELLLVSTENGGSLSAEELGRELFPETQAGAAADRVHTLVYRIRKKLEALYSNSSGIGTEELQVVSGESGYQLQLARRTVRDAQDSSRADPPTQSLTEFWEKYLTKSEGSVQIQTSDRFFVAFGEHLYLRHTHSGDGFDLPLILKEFFNGFPMGNPPANFSEDSLARFVTHVNQAVVDALVTLVASGAEEGCGLNETSSRELKRHVAERLRHCYFPSISRDFVSAGEVAGLSNIAEMFSRFRREVIFGNQPGTTTENRHVNLIQVGRPRQATELARLLERLPLTLAHDGVSQKGNSEGQLFSDDMFEDSFAHRSPLSLLLKSQNQPVLKHVLLTRCTNEASGHVITHVGSNHGRATEAVCRALSVERLLRDLFRKLSWEAAIPPFFQVVVRVNVLRGRDGERASGEIDSIAYQQVIDDLPE